MSGNVIAFRKREKPKVKPPEAAPSKRLEAIDILRGLCVIGMILVAYGGDWANRYSVLNHADWHGLVLADMIFPGFLFCVGAAMPFSFSGRAARQTRGQLALHILWRALALILLGTLLNFLAQPTPEGFRLPGILQRIGLCYGLAGGVCLLAGRKSDHDFTIPALPVMATACIVAAGYAAALLLWTSPPCGASCFDPVFSLPAVVDRAVFTPAYMWPWGLSDGHVTYDPEGLVSTLGALINVLLGIITALYVRQHGVTSALVGIAFLGVFLIVVGLGFDSRMPVIKKIWTPTFAIISSGFAMIVFAGLAVLTHFFKAGRWLAFAKVFGANATLAFVLISLINIGMEWPAPDGAVNAHGGLMNILSIIPDAKLASLSYSLVLLVVLAAVLWPLYRKRWFLKL